MLAFSSILDRVTDFGSGTRPYDHVNLLQQRPQNGSKYLLQAPSEQDLTSGLPVLLHQWLQNRFIGPLIPHNWTIRLDYHPSLLAPFHNVRSSEPWMHFPLPNTDLASFAFTLLAFELLDIGFKLVEMMNAVVRDADGADLAGLLGFD